MCFSFSVMLFFVFGGFVCFVCFLFAFPFLLWKKNCFSPRKWAYLFIFQCLPLFLPSLIHSLFSLSLSLSIWFLSFFLVFFLSCLFASVFLALCFFCLFAFVSWKEQHQDIKLQSVFFINPCCFLFPVLLCLSSPVFLSLFFLILNCVSRSASMFYHSKRDML